MTNTQEMIALECDALKEILLDKNRKYGDSAINPKRIFSKASAVEQIKVRLDDKLSRLMNQQSDEDEDVIQDLLGYLILYRVAMKKGNENGKDKSQQNETMEKASEGDQRTVGEETLREGIKTEYTLNARDTIVSFKNDANECRYYYPHETTGVTHKF